MDHVIGFGVKGISKGIAIVSETVVARKNKSKPEPNSRSQSIVHDSDEQEQGIIDRVWELDEVAAQVGSANGESEKANEQNLLQGININHGTQLKPLPQPVILPQRRPGTRGRGFIRAYAPSLGECSDIDQETFLAFLNNFDKASKTSPIFDVINIACFGVGLVPDAVCLAVSITVGTVNGFAQDIQRRYRTNKYLDDINDSLFKPRGLYCMVMAYRPDLPDEAVLSANLGDDAHGVALQKILDRGNSKLKSKLARLRGEDGTVRSDLQMPVPAPLVYPALDRAIEAAAPSEGRIPPPASKPSDSTGQDLVPVSTSKSVAQPALKSDSKSALIRITSLTNNPVVQDYLDRRAQTDFILRNPSSKLANTLPPQKEYVNRFADPDHPVNSGSILGLLTGGRFDPVSQGRVSRAQRKARRQGESPLTLQEKHDAYMGRKVRGRVTGTPSKSLPIIGKVFKRDVLYLVVVNLPSDQEMQTTMEQME